MAGTGSHDACTGKAPPLPIGTSSAQSVHRERFCYLDHRETLAFTKPKSSTDRAAIIEAVQASWHGVELKVAVTPNLLVLTIQSKAQTSGECIIDPCLYNYEIAKRFGECIELEVVESEHPVHFWQPVRRSFIFVEPKQSQELLFLRDCAILESINGQCVSDLNTLFEQFRSSERVLLGVKYVPKRHACWLWNSRWSEIPSSELEHCEFVPVDINAKPTASRICLPVQVEEVQPNEDPVELRSLKRPGVGCSDASPRKKHRKATVATQETKSSAFSKPMIETGKSVISLDELTIAVSKLATVPEDESLTAEPQPIAGTALPPLDPKNCRDRHSRVRSEPKAAGSQPWDPRQHEAPVATRFHCAGPALPMLDQRNWLLPPDRTSHVCQHWRSHHRCRFRDTGECSFIHVHGPWLERFPKLVKFCFRIPWPVSKQRYEKHVVTTHRVVNGISWWTAGYACLSNKTEGFRKQDIVYAEGGRRSTQLLCWFETEKMARDALKRSFGVSVYASERGITPP